MVPLRVILPKFHCIYYTVTDEPRINAVLGEIYRADHVFHCCGRRPLRFVRRHGRGRETGAIPKRKTLANQNYREHPRDQAQPDGTTYNEFQDVELGDVEEERKTRRSTARRKLSDSYTVEERKVFMPEVDGATPQESTPKPVVLNQGPVVKADVTVQKEVDGEKDLHGKRSVSSIVKKLMPSTSFRESLKKEELAKKEEKSPVKSGGESEKVLLGGGDDSGFETVFKKVRKGKF